MASDRYDIHISFESDGESHAITDALVQAFESATASVAQAGSLTREEDRVTVHFHDLFDQVPASGAEFDPPRPEDPHEASGRVAVQHLRNVTDEPSALVPIARALIAVSAARQRAGLSPRQRITIEVEPSAVHTQDELRHDHV